MTEVQAKIQEYFDDDIFVEAIDKATTPQELMSIMNNKGIVFEDVTAQEVFDAFQNAKDLELNEDDLEEVNGGVAISVSIGGLSLAVAGSAGAILLCAGGLAVIGLATYWGYRVIKKRTK